MNIDWTCDVQSRLNYLYAEEETLSTVLPWEEEKMKQMEEDLCDYPMIVRCHRAFLVNLAQVEQIVSRAGAMQLVIKHCNESLPVSRSHAAQVKAAIN